MNKKELSIDTKKFGIFAAICTMLFTLFSGWLIYHQSDQALPLIPGIGALIYGPLCFILYIIEVARGVFKAAMKKMLRRRLKKRYENSIGSGFF